MRLPAYLTHIDISTKVLVKDGRHGSILQLLTVNGKVLKGTVAELMAARQGLNLNDILGQLSCKDQRLEAVWSGLGFAKVSKFKARVAGQK